MNKNKHISEDEFTDKPDDIYLQKIPCKANWQLYTNGSIGKLRCRKCKVYVVDGGTPKCLLNDGKGI